MIKDTSISSRLFSLFVFLAGLFALLICFLPILHIASISLSDNISVDAMRVSLIPVGWDLAAYKVILTKGGVPRAFMNSVYYTALGTTINIVLTTAMAYGLSKKRIAFRKLLTILIVIPFFFSGGLIPLYLLVRKLGMYNTVWALVVPPAIGVWNIIILRTFFQSLPQELEDSGVVDGANDMVIFARIALPMTKAAIATITLFCAVGHWNSWFSAIIYLRDAERYPLQVLLRQIIMFAGEAERLSSQGDFEAAELSFAKRQAMRINVDRIKYAMLFVSIFPMLILYPFLQKYFVKGLMIGSLKG